ncbi:conserved repeat protein [Clostridium sp. CAG:590]|nr:conserved repeat protein [Clostridium sp. CAG:590]
MTKKEKKLLAVLMVLIMGFTMLPGNFSAAMSDIINTATEVSEEDKQTTEKQTETATTEVVTTAADTSIESTEKGESTTMAATVESSIVDTEQQTEAVTTEMAVKTRANRKVKKMRMPVSKSAGTPAKLDNYLDASACQVTIGGVIITPGSSAPIEVAYNDKISINLNWKFVDNQFPTSQNDSLTYELPSNIAFDTFTGDLMDGSTIVGHYYLNGNTITLKYDAGEESDAFLGQSGRHGSLTATGKLGNDVLNNGKGGQTSFTFNALGTFNIDMKRDDRNDGVSIQKMGGRLDESTMTAEYKLKITATGPQTNIKATDKMGSNLELDGEPTYWEDEACTKSYTDNAPTKSNTTDGFVVTVPALKDKTIFVKYKVKLKDEKALVYDSWDDKAGVSNSASVSSDTTTDGGTSWKNLEYTKRVVEKWVSKDHTVSTDQSKITWKVTVNPNGYNIAGAKIKDILGTEEHHVGPYIDGTLSSAPALPGNPTWSDLQNGYTFPAGTDNNTYMITYDTEMGDVSTTEQYTKSNTIQINPYGNTYDMSKTDYCTIGSNHEYIKKVCDTTGNSSTDVEWTITVKVPKGGSSSDMRVTDTIPAGMTCTASDITINRVTGITPSVAGNTITIPFGAVAEGTYTIKVKTHIDPVPAKDTTYQNTATYIDGTVNKNSSADYTYKPEQYLKKETANRSDFPWDYSTGINWKLIVSALPADTTTSIIEDTLPGNLKYKNGSLKVYETDDWSSVENSALTNSIHVTTSSNKIYFEITGDALTHIKTAGKQLCLFYTTDYVDLNQAMTSQDYVNKAFIKVNDRVCPEVPATAQWKQLKKDSIIDKTGQYDATTAPNVKYTITVNENALDLDAASDQLLLKDVMGSAIEYYPGSMKIDGVTATSQQVSYDASTRTLEVKVPDSKKVVITYMGTITLDVGAALTDANCVNSCSLSGVGDAGTDKYRPSATAVIKSAGSSTSNGVVIHIVKHKKGETTNYLPNAEFTCSEMAYNAATGVVGTAITSQTVASNTVGKASFSNLYRAKLYRIVETKAPANYKIDTTPRYFLFKETGNTGTYPSNVTENGVSYPVHLEEAVTTSYTYSFPNEAITSHPVQISKVDITSSKELAGASLKITDKATGAEVATWTSGSDKDAVGNLIPHTITLAEGTYILTETKAPADYKVADPIEFTVAGDGTVTSATAGAASGTKVTMKDATIDKGKLKITKTISGTVTKEQAEASVQFTVVDNSDQHVVGTYQLSDFTYDATNKIWTKELNCNVGGYTVTETVTAIGGYMLSKVSYVIDSAAAQDGEVATANVTKGTTTTVAYTNTYDPAAHSVDISKVDAAKGEEIAGAELTITDKTSNLVVAKWTSGDKKDAAGNVIPYTVTLAAGTYTLTETKAPTGYEVADPIDFTVGNDGKVTSTTHASNIVGVNKVVMKDVKEKPGTLKLTKTVAGTVSKEDAEKTIQFKVTDAAGTEVATYKLSEFTYDTASKTWTKTLDCTAGKYTVTETVTDVTGYTLTSVTYTIDSGAATTGKAADVTLVKGNVTTVAFKNSYQESPTTTEATTTTTETATEVTTETEATTEVTTEVTTEQITTDEDKTEVDTHSKETTGKKTRSKKTGDTAPIAATGGMLLISLVGLGVLYRKKKKND